MKKLIFLLVAFFATFYLPAQEKQKPDTIQKKQVKKPAGKYVKVWRVSEQLGIADTVRVDSAWLNFQDHNPIDTFAIGGAYNGNLGSPFQSKIYYKRPQGSDFLFDDAFRPYILDIKSAYFYDTKSPFTNLTYKTGSYSGCKEDQVKFTFAASPSKKISFGTDLDYIYSTGAYNNIASKRFSGGIFGRYNGRHYSANGLVAVNNHFNFDNGGIEDLNQLYNTVGASPGDLLTRFASYSIFKKAIAYYNHQYSIGFNREVKVNEDSVRYDYIPVTRFGHTLKYEELKKKYLEPNGTTAGKFYQNTYSTKHNTNDSVSMRSLSNVFFVNLAEEFNKWMRFGLTGYVENEMQQFNNYSADSVLTREWKSSTRVGGVLSKNQGTNFRYNVLGDIYLLGYKLGEFSLEAKALGHFKVLKKDISLIAEAYVKNEAPSYFLQHYVSNHFQWDNSFSKTYRTSVAGTFALPATATWLKIGVENVTNTIYFNEKMMPDQHNGNVQILYADLKQNFDVFHHFALENNAVYQATSNANVVPLPMLSLYHNLYYHGTLFKVLKTQIGTSVRFHTRYYAPSYISALAQFYNQKETLIGNYPLMNAYLNFHLKQARFFFEYYHVNHLFMKGEYLSMPNYPLGPNVLKMGLSWNFYN